VNVPDANCTEKTKMDFLKFKICSSRLFLLLFVLRSVFLCDFSVSSVSSVVKLVRSSRMDQNIFNRLLVYFASLGVFREIRVWEFLRFIFTRGV